MGITDHGGRGASTGSGGVSSARKNGGVWGGFIFKEGWLVGSVIVSVVVYIVGF